MRQSRLVVIFILCLISGFPGRLYAQPDTLDELPLVQYGTDSARSLDIIAAFTWNIELKQHDGSVHNYITRRPDTVLNNRVFDTLRMSADVVVGPSLVNEILALHYVLEGALSVSLNGANLVETGEFSKINTYELKRYAPDGMAWFSFSDGLQHLAVLYVPYKRTHIFELALKIYSKSAAERHIQENIDDRDRDRGVAFYYLAFGIVFMSLFVSTRQKTEYLSFSLFCLFGAVCYILDTVDIGFLYNLESFAGIFCFEFLAIFFCKILMQRDRSKWPLIIIITAFCICAFPNVRYFYANMISTQGPVLIGVTYFVLYVYTICAVLYYLIQGVGKKQWEARTIVLVCLVPFLFFIVACIVMLIIAGIKTNNNDMRYNLWFFKFGRYLWHGIVYVYPLSVVYIVGRRNIQTQRTLQEQVASIGKLSEENLQKEKEKQHILENQKEHLEREVSLRTAEIVTQKEEIERQHSELKVEKKKSDDLLRNILPDEIAAELKAKGHSDAKLFDNVTVLFTDFVNFTAAGEQMTPQALIDELHACFKAFDEITTKYNLEKIKTIGDAYLAVCGLPVADYKHAEKVVSAAREINAFMQHRLSQRGDGSFNIRIGVHSGPVVAGIVGVKKFAYDVWGDTVNTAARLEQKGEPGKINISQSTYELVKDVFTCEYRGEIAAKNKGPMKMYFVQ